MRAVGASWTSIGGLIAAAASPWPPPSRAPRACPPRVPGTARATRRPGGSGKRRPSRVGALTIRPETPVGRIAAEHPIATRVFGRHQVDFCCGGGKPIEDVCVKRGLDVTAVLAEIDEELAGDTADLEDWNNAPSSELVEHIVNAYHRPLDEELPRLEIMARKVLRVHGDKISEVLPELLTTLLALQADLKDHMAKEEELLFPAILEGSGTAGTAPIEELEDEHAVAGDALRRLRELTDDYRVPDGACNTWRALWHGLAELESAMHQHIHLENNVLFPRIGIGDSKWVGLG